MPSRQQHIAAAIIAALTASLSCGPPETVPPSNGTDDAGGSGLVATHPDPRLACGDRDCDDGLACNGLERCVRGRCVDGPLPDCDDADPCTQDLCTERPDGAACLHLPVSCPSGLACDALDGECRCVEGAACDDGDACTRDDVCLAGVCTGQHAADCDDGNPCTLDGCTALTGCLFLPIPDCAQDSATSANPADPDDSGDEPPAVGGGGGDPGGGPADDGGTNDDPEGEEDDPDQDGEGDEGEEDGDPPDDPLPCTVNEDCDDGNPCTDDVCDTDTCVNTPNADPCDDADDCTAADTCASGICTGAQVPDCLPCILDPDCDDGDACTLDQCVDAACTHIATGECDDGNPCTDDLCDPFGVCLHTPNAAPCDDGNPCTMSDVCADAACGGTPQSGCDPPDHALCVRTGAVGAATGSDWFNAFPELTSALLAAGQSGGTISEIWVAAGTYRPDFDTDAQTYTASRTVTFQLLPNVALLGGFAGGEIARTQRDPAMNLTVLTGDIGVSADPSDNSYHVVTASGLPASAVLDGFTISGGNAEGALLPSGGGLLAETGSPTIANCTFLDNRATNAGAMYLLDTTATVANCRFLGNSGTGGSANGGAMNIQGGGAVVANCVFAGNSAALGAGAMLAGSPTLSHCTFYANEATGLGGGLYVFSSASPVIDNCVLWANVDADGAGESAQLFTVGGPMGLSHSCIQGLTQLAGDGLIGNDPQFTDPAGADGVPGTIDDDLRPAAGSPCIDAGDPAGIPSDLADLDGDGDTTEPLPHDLDGRPRSLGCGAAAPDMGPYEKPCQ